MLFPGGKILHKDLSTNYTRSYKLISDLGESRFSGYLKISFWEYDDYLIFDTGKIIQAMVKTSEKLDSGHEALKQILNHLEEKEGTISAHILNSEILPIISSIHTGQLIKSDKISSHEALHQIINEAIKEGEVGYLEFQFGKKQGVGAVYFSSGSILATVLRSRSGRTVTENNSGQLLNRFYKLVDSLPTFTTFYHCDPLTAYEASEELQKWVYFYQYIFIQNKLHKHLMTLLGYVSKNDLYRQFMAEGLGHIAADYGFTEIQMGNTGLYNFNSYDVSAMKSLYFNLIADVLAKMEDMAPLNYSALRLGMEPFFRKYDRSIAYYDMNSDIENLLEK